MLHYHYHKIFIHRRVTTIALCIEKAKGAEEFINFLNFSLVCRARHTVINIFVTFLCYRRHVKTCLFKAFLTVYDALIFLTNTMTLRELLKINFPKKPLDFPTHLHYSVQEQRISAFDAGTIFRRAYRSRKSFPRDKRPIYQAVTEGSNLRLNCIGGQLERPGLDFEWPRHLIL